MDPISNVTNVHIDTRYVSESGGTLTGTNLADNSQWSRAVSKEVGDATEEGKDYSFTETWSDYVAPEAAAETEKQAPTSGNDPGDEQQ